MAQADSNASSERDTLLRSGRVFRPYYPHTTARAYRTTPPWADYPWSIYPRLEQYRCRNGRCWKQSRRELSEEVLLGIGALLVLEQSSLESLTRVTKSYLLALGNPPQGDAIYVLRGTAISASTSTLFPRETRATVGAVSPTGGGGLLPRRGKSRYRVSRT